MMACNFPGAHAVGKPKDWIPELDGSCGTVFCLDDYDLALNRNWKYSLYLPTPEDIVAINNGGALRLGMPDPHPVFNMVWLGGMRTKELELVPMWDLGSPMI